MENEKDFRTRKWLVTINNPVDKGFTHEYIREVLASFKSIEYWCMADEIGEKGTYHTHVFAAFHEVVRKSTMMKKFPKMHLDPCSGTCQQNRDYVFKEGKHEKTQKAEGHISETREEYGQVPIERPGQRNDIVDLQDMVKSGMTNDEIIKEMPKYSFKINDIDRLRQTLLKAKYSELWRNVEVTYIYGETATGKTRSVIEEHGYKNCYFATNYKNPFDGYDGQDVLVFEEFRSSLHLADMLKYLDGHPLLLPARYYERVAMYTKVYIISNVPLEKQYPNIQINENESWDAFVRRIHWIKKFNKGQQAEREYMNPFTPTQTNIIMV
jgi:hypothetical protein